MSSVYVLEPPTRGKVILNTTEGPLDIELWPKEAPKAVRNFVQLCVDGYYDNTAFHRIIKGFMVQGGDRSGTGTGGESIYGAPYADEFHSRLRFNHRGLVGCANPGIPNSNNSQFFISLDRCEWLDRKNTIFGKVTGDTIYNLLKIGEVETGVDDKPVDPVPMILSVEVLWCPFDDIVPTKSIKPVETTTEDVETKSKTKKVKQLNLLSFGEEAEQEEQELAGINVKIKSSHDILNDPRLLKAEDEAKHDEIEEKRRKEMQASVKEALKKNTDNKKNADDDSDQDINDDDFDAIMRRKVLSKMKKFEDGPAPKKSAGKKSVPERKPPSPREDEEEEDDDEDNDNNNDHDRDRGSLRRDKLSLKKKGVGSEVRADQLLKADMDAQLLGHAEQQRHINKQKKRARQGREEATLEKLKQFQSNLLKAKSEASKKQDAEEEDDSGWLNHRLQFVRDQQNKDKMARNDDPDQYVVHDPLLEKGKEKFNKMQAKLKRREREWAGKSIT